MQKPHLPVRDFKEPILKQVSIWPRMEICGRPGLPLAMVPFLHQSNVYVKRKLRIWRVEKCIPLVCAKTSPVLDCKRPRLESASVGSRMKICRNPGLPFAMVPCLHQSNVYIKKNLLVWRVEKCILFVGEKTALTSAVRQTTPSHVSQYRAENGNLRKSGSTFRHGTVIAPKQCLYQKEATGMESPKMHSSSRCKYRTYLFRTANYAM